ncbi:MAG: DNA starvation/stationary phase protection protein [Pseudomonadota bacterium]
MTQSVLTATAQTETPETGVNEIGQIADALAGVLSDSQLLLVKTQAVHWNVSGPMFHSIHSLTEEQYTELFQAIDELAERIRALGQLAPISMAGMLSQSALKESDDLGDAQAMLTALVADHEALVRQARDVATLAAEHRDGATEDLMNARMAVHEKAAWMLRAMAG